MMFYKILFVSIITIILSSCSIFGKQPVRTETQNVNKPILYCPAPVTPDQPNLAIYTISESDSDGMVVKKYKATVQQLRDYADQLEKQLQKYDQTSDAYKQLREQFKQQREQDGFTTPEN